MSADAERPGSDADAVARSRYRRIAGIIVLLAAFGLVSAWRNHSGPYLGAAGLMLAGAACVFLADRARIDEIDRRHLAAYGVEAVWLVVGAGLTGTGLYVLAHG